MKTTIDIPDDLFRQSKATAAMRGETLRDFVTAALRDRLERQPSQIAPPTGWRSVFGRARAEEVAPVDQRIEEALERVDPREWT